MVKSILISSKAQTWGLDLVIAITIFLVGIIATYIYAINFLNESQDILDELFYDGNFVSSLILSEGSPANWTEKSIDEIEFPGILTDKEINQTKLDRVYDLSQEDYSKLKRMFNTRYEFYFYFNNMRVAGENIEGIGNKPLNSQNLIKTERFTIYNNEPTKFVIYIWN